MEKISKHFWRGVRFYLALLILASCATSKYEKSHGEPYQNLLQEIKKTESQPFSMDDQDILESYESFLRQYVIQNPEFRKQALKRIGDLSLKKSQQSYVSQMEAYEKESNGPPPLLNYDTAIDAYQKLLEEDGDFPQNDEV